MLNENAKQTSAYTTIIGHLYSLQITRKLAAHGIIVPPYSNIPKPCSTIGSASGTTTYIRVSTTTVIGVTISPAGLLQAVSARVVNNKGGFNIIRVYSV